MPKGTYHTKQREELLEFLQGAEGQHITVSDACSHFQARGSKVGTTTIYRHLEKMVKEGIVKKYVMEAGSPACFEYVSSHEECRESGCVHLKCTECGKLIHLHCDELQATGQHILKDHGFQIDVQRTVLYGRCEACRGEA